jgi:hypothetical protein
MTHKQNSTPIIHTYSLGIIRTYSRTQMKRKRSTVDEEPILTPEEARIMFTANNYWTDYYDDREQLFEFNTEFSRELQLRIASGWLQDRDTRREKIMCCINRGGVLDTSKIQRLSKAIVALGKKMEAKTDIHARLYVMGPMRTGRFRNCYKQAAALFTQECVDNKLRWRADGRAETR